MNVKYQKPYLRNLGDSLPSALGECAYGTVARSNVGFGCYGGSQATGATCSPNGSNAAGTGCDMGQDPEGFGCTNGYKAGGCTTGTSAF